MINFSDEILQFIFNNFNGISYTKMTSLVNEKFNTNFTVNQIHYQYEKYELHSGLTGGFEKGNIPWNKNKPISEWNLTEETKLKMKSSYYKKGNIPWDTLSIGTERLKNGFVEIKIDNPNKWKRKHIVLWEKVNGPIPKNHYIIFLDGDRFNFDLSNLILISKEENLRLNEKNWRFKDKDLQEVALNTIRLGIKLGEKHETHNDRTE